MFDHVGVRVSDLAATDRFYTTVLGAAGLPPAERGTYVEFEDFALGAATADRPVTTGLHVGFTVASREAVDAFWHAGTGAGHRDDGPPGPRAHYGPDYYAAFLRDPDGNSVEAVVGGAGRRDGGHVDHLSLRVADRTAARAFYDAIAAPADLQRADDDAELTAWTSARAGGRLSVRAGAEPTRHLHVAFAATERRTVDAFHAAALAAGYRDNGAPGERPEYHPGYYGAFVLDPDGTNVEVVVHG